jgi:hypothetical protein
MEEWRGQLVGDKSIFTFTKGVQTFVIQLLFLGSTKTFLFSSPWQGKD